MPANVLGYVAAAVIAVCGAAFASFAGYLGLREVLRPVLAALLTGVALLALALLIAWLARLAGRRRRRHHDPVEEAVREHIDELLSAGIRRHPAGAALGTLLLGVAAGRARNNERKEQARGGAR